MTQPPTPPIHTPENWDEAGVDYDANIADFTAQYAPPALDWLDPGAQSRVLEVAAGSGAMTLQLAPRCGEVLATDYSQGMLDLLATKLGKAGISNVSTAQMNGMALDVPDGSYDHAISQFGIMLFDDPQKGIDELCRALVPGGTAVISAWSTPDRFEAFGLFGQVLQIALPDMPRPPGPPPIFSLSDPGRFTAMMMSSGFSEARVEHVTHRWTTPNPQHFVEVFEVSAPPARALFAQIGPEKTQRVREVMHGILTERFGDGPVALSNTATIGVARK